VVRNLSAYLCERQGLGDEREQNFWDNRRRSLWTILYCLRCSVRSSRTKSVAVFVFAQTTGVRPRQKILAQRICFLRNARFRWPWDQAPEGALNPAAWQMIRDIVAPTRPSPKPLGEVCMGLKKGAPATGTGGAAPPAGAGSYFEF